MTGRCVVGLALVIAFGAACGSRSPERQMLPDGKEAIYGFLSQGRVAIADEALQDTWDVGARAHPVHISPITWREDPFDKYWRVLFYGLRPLSNLLFAYYTTGKRAYLDKLCDTLRSYTAFEAQRGDAPNAFLDDPHTAAFREMMLVNVRGKLLRTHDLPDDLDAPLQAAIEKTAAFLADEAHFEGSQNHGFTEAAALLVAAANLSEMPQADAWQALALGRLGVLMRDVVDDDGVEIENSPFYHFYVLSFVLQDSKWMHSYGAALPDGFDDKLSRMFAYATYAPMPNGQLPLLGSSVALNVRKLRPEVYGESPDEVAGLDGVTPDFEYVRSAGAAGSEPSERNQRFEVSGQAFLRSGFGPRRELDGRTWMSFNVGRWRSKHCHLDALAITYCSDGVALLPDSGLYEYPAGGRAAPDPRIDYFVGTRAHNTVVVDGRDQSNAHDVAADVFPGLRASGGDWAYQSGSHRLYAGVAHARSVVLLGQDLALVVDTLASDSAHDYVQTWHLWPDAQIEPSRLDVAARDAAGHRLALSQAVTDGVVLRAVRGQDSPVVQGYLSSEYGRRVESYALEYAARGARVQFVTAVASGARATAGVGVRAQQGAGGDVHAVVCSGDVGRDIAIHAQAQPGEQVAVASSAGCP
jgi:hypothetical protein